MADFIEGKRPVIEALRTGVPIKSILMADNVQQDGQIKDILRKARQHGVKVKPVSRKMLDDMSERGSHQGVIILDHITDAGNLGAVSRSAEAVGACGIVIPNKRSAHVEASTYKSSAGAIAHVPVAQVSNLVQTMSRLKEEGFWIAGATEHASDLIWKANLKGKIALVMGNEQEGISRLVMEHCDFLVKLPIEGEVASLNVAQAATACMYEWLRQNQ